MSSCSFVHLHCHSEYSRFDGTSSTEALLRRAKELGMNALALTDHGNLDGVWEFYENAIRLGVKPILGYEAYMAPGDRSQQGESAANGSSFHLTLLAENRTGFQNLIKLASAAYPEGVHLWPHIDRKLLTRYHEGLICLSGCESSEVSQAILRDSEKGLERAMNIASWYQDLFRDRYLLEIQNNGLELQRRAMNGIIEISRRLDIDMVATSDVHWVDREDSQNQKRIQDFRLDADLAALEKSRCDDWDFHLRSPREMYEAFEGMEETVWLTQEVADLIDLELNKRYFPSADSYARNLIEMAE